MPKGANSSKAQKESKGENKVLKVTFSGEKKGYAFKNAIICGTISDVKNNESDELSSIICGFTDIADFISVFNNIIVQAYDFLSKNADNNKEEIILALEDMTELIFTGLRNNEFDDYFSKTVVEDDVNSEE